MLDETERIEERMKWNKERKKMDKIEILASGFLDLVKKVSGTYRVDLALES